MISLVNGYKPLEIGTALDSYCPIFNISTDFPPTLLLHGSADTDVPVEQSKEMYVALTNAGIKAELVIVPDIEHGFDFDWSNKPDELGLLFVSLKRA